MFSTANVKNAFRREFGGQETDYDLQKSAENRKKTFRESFGEFRLAIETLLARMKRPLEEVEKVSIMRRNMRPELQKALIVYHSNSVVELCDACRKHENVVTIGRNW